MPLPTKNEDHEGTLLGRLAHQLKEKPLFAVPLQALAAQLQELENVFWDLLTKRTIATAEGELLDMLGAWVAQPRVDATDAEYRLRILAKVNVLRSKGRPEDIYRIFRVLFPSAALRYIPGYPAGFDFDIAYSVPAAPAALSAAFLRAATSAGVRSALIWAQGNEAATFHFSLSTFLSVAPGGGATTITVDSTAGFPETGSLRIGAGLAVDETRAYTAKTATTFTVAALANAHTLREDVQLVPGIGLGWSDTASPAVGGELAGTSEG